MPVRVRIDKALIAQAADAADAADAARAADAILQFLARQFARRTYLSTFMPVRDIALGRCLMHRDLAM